MSQNVPFLMVKLLQFHRPNENEKRYFYLNPMHIAAMCPQETTKTGRKRTEIYLISNEDDIWVAEHDIEEIEEIIRQSMKTMIVDVATLTKEITEEFKVIFGDNEDS